MIRPRFPSPFFAVATVEFSDRPLALQQHAPDLYSVLGDDYRQEPVARVGRCDGVSG